jgi:formate-dependent nitrite reductase cytochrome c552 subunit
MQQPIVLDTLGKLHAHGYRLFGWCRDCHVLAKTSSKSGRPALSLWRDSKTSSTDSVSPQLPTTASSSRLADRNGLAGRWLRRRRARRHALIT